MFCRFHYLPTLYLFFVQGDRGLSGPPGPGGAPGLAVSAFKTRAELAPQYLQDLIVE